MIGAVNGDQEIVLTPRRVALTSLETWCQSQLQPSDEVVLEATTNAWHIHDMLEPLVARVVVVQCQLVENRVYLHEKMSG